MSFIKTNYDKENIEIGNRLKGWKKKKIKNPEDQEKGLVAEPLKSVSYLQGFQIFLVSCPFSLKFWNFAWLLILKYPFLWLDSLNNFFNF